MHDFEIKFLEHVAICVADVEVSAKWYEEILGLKRGHPPIKPGDPKIMESNGTGVAIFQTSAIQRNEDRVNFAIEHFAFQVSQSDFIKAQRYLNSIGVSFILKNHHYVKSLYIRDPDNIEVELTTPNLTDRDENYSISS